MGTRPQRRRISLLQQAVGAAAALSLSAGVLGAVVAAPSSGHHPPAEEASGVIAPVPTTPAAAPAEADGVIVRFAPGVGRDEAADLVAQHGGELQEPVAGTGYYEVSVAPGDEAAFQQSLAGSHGVAEAEVNHVRRAFLVPNDVAYTQQSPYLQAVNLPSAWDLTTGADNLVLAILDSGIRANHPDFTGRLLPGTDIVNGDTVPNDDYGHGTWVAGVAAARTDNVNGVAGVAWKGKIMPVKVIDHKGLASDAHIAAGIHYATDHGAHVINLSLGGPGASSMLQEAIDYAVARGVVLVAAAGNAGETEPNWPAAARNVIAVGASDSAGNQAPFSNYGHWLDILAPGIDIVTTEFGGGYQKVDGTSFASPIVAGIALLLRSVDPTVTPAEVADRLRRSARDVGDTGFDPFTGAGLVDAGAALRIGGFSSAGSGGSGYWMLGGDGAVYSFGDAPYAGEPYGDSFTAVDVEPMPAQRGYWLLSQDGAVHTFGENRYYGRVTPDRDLDVAGGETVTSLSATPAGDGYWIFTNRGRVFSFGAAGVLGDLTGVALNKPVVDSIPAPNGQGYYMVAADGGVFAVGPGAGFHGSLPEVLGGRLPNRPVRSLVPDPDGTGYWLVAEDGGVFSFDAPYRGSVPAIYEGVLNAPVVGMVPYGDGYLMVATDGGIFDFSLDLDFMGSLGADAPDAPVVAVAALPR